MPPKSVKQKNKLYYRSRFQKHTKILIWKCYLQRQRRWGLLLVEAAFGLLLFVAAIFIAKPVFLIPLQDEPEPPLGSADVLASLTSDTILGYAPNFEPYATVMNKASILLGIEVMSAEAEDGLNEMLYNQSRGVPLKSPVIWVIWKPRDGNIWDLSIRSTERARYITSSKQTETSNPHLRSGFLAVQLAISQSIVEFVSESPVNFEISLVAMPVSPLMEEAAVRKALSGILLCFTLAFIPPVLETEALVVTETVNMFKRALRLRNVGYSSMYVSWLVYAYLTALPICLLASIFLIMIFRWIHLFAALLVMFAYVSVMIMLALMMGMFHNKASIACVWTTLFTLLQTYLADLLIHHQYDKKHQALTFVLHLILPPIGLVHALNQFALLQTGGTSEVPNAGDVSKASLIYMVASWGVMNLIYFGLLMLLQRTIGQKRAIGGQVSWRSIIFKKAEDKNKVHQIHAPSGRERGKLQEVDELVAKAISFRDVSKSIMGVPVLNYISFDIYRGEFTILFTERIQETICNTIDDLLTGLTLPDHGSITVLGEPLKLGTCLMTTTQMMGYCHYAESLIEDLTVMEHFTMFNTICLWNKKKSNILEYTHIRSKRLLKECDLDAVKYERVRNLNIYYKAQLCWALAEFLEPKIIVVPHFSNCPRIYVAVIKDKIMQFKKYKTIVTYNFSSIKLECADRVFMFDSKELVFGGTPAYMFFRYGREYRLRITLKNYGLTEETESENLLLSRAEQAGATVRAHLGSMLILRLPAIPSSNVAEFVRDLTDNSNKYGITSFNISVADSEEVCRRAITEARSASFIKDPEVYATARLAMKRIAEPAKWRRLTSTLNTHLGSIIWKFFTFHLNNRIFFAATLISAVTAGIFLGLSLSAVLIHINPDKAPKKMLSVETLTVENLKVSTTLVLRVDNSTAGTSIAKGYVMSDTKSTHAEIEKIEYTALAYTESLTEYLITRAIDSPQLYVYLYAYGMEVSTDVNGTVQVEALYSPIHHDQSAAARSLARVYMALLRHYSGFLDATIKINDDPLALDLSPLMTDLTQPPLFIQFLLMLTISHITLLPSQEYGLIRHVQKHATNFSPARYWLTLYFCDLILYWLLVAVMSFAIITLMFLTIPTSHFQSVDLLIVPLMLTVYGIGCVPQAYIFSLGPRMALNTMSYVIVNLVFGETTIITKILYGDVFNIVVDFMTLSPQFNMAYAYVKIKQIFLYNSECLIFEKNDLCSVHTFHKCCEKCGVLQHCFSRKSYFTRHTGILMEAAAMFTIAVFFTGLLLLIEYRIFHKIWSLATAKIANRDKPSLEKLTLGCAREKAEVLDKKKEIDNPQRDKVDTFGEYLLAYDLTKRSGGLYAVHNVFLGLGKGEAVALTGHEHQGRSLLCEMLAGYTVPSDGNVCAMSKYKLRYQPHQYCRHVSISCNSALLPPWLKVKDALYLIATLRGVPRKYIKQEVNNHIEALELQQQANKYIDEILPYDRTRINFAAAVIGAPPIVILDECTAYQKFSIKRAMYFILNTLRRRGHSFFICSSIESHMPVTNRLAIVRDGTIYDVDSVDNLVRRYSDTGYTVVVHLKNEVDVAWMFSYYFQDFIINDTTEVLVNIQVHDPGLTWADIFEKMEKLQKENHVVYSYIVTVIPIDYIYNSIISKWSGRQKAKGLFSWKWWKKIMSIKPEIMPKKEALNKLIPFEQKYDITKLKELPWSVIFHR